MGSPRLLRTVALVAALLSFAVGSALPASASPSDPPPAIGVDRAPDDAEPICPIPYVGPTYDSAGLAPGTMFPDFTLFTAAGEPVTLASILAHGRPVLLVAGSFSCPVFRSSIATLNEMAEQYRGRLEILVVYVVEAHPVVDASPYFGVENVTTQNRYADILVRQPTTYGERRVLVDSLLARFAITPPIVIDGPCNEWWSASGRAANHAVLLRPDGRVAAWHGWFRREPHDMPAEVARMVGVSGVSEGRAATRAPAGPMRIE